MASRPTTEEMAAMMRRVMNNSYSSDAEKEREMVEMKGRMHIGEAYKDTKAELIAAHEGGRKQMMSTMSHKYAQAMSVGQARPGASATAMQSDRVAALLPIRISQLREEVTHRGRVLPARFVVDSFTYTGTHSVIEDENGDVCRMSIYNLLPPVAGTLTAERLVQVNTAGRLAMPNGAFVAVLEPFYKVSMDGKTVLRVDEPQDVVLMPPSVTNWSEANAFCVATVNDAVVSDHWSRYKAEGNKLFAAGHHADAAASFSSAIASDNQLLLNLLNNNTLCQLELKMFDAALRTAIAAIAVDPINSKAYHRAALALEGLMLLPAAHWCASEAVRLSTVAASTALIKQVATRLQKRLKAAGTAAVAAGDAGRKSVLSLLASTVMLNNENAAAIAAASEADSSKTPQDPFASKDSGNNAFRAGDYATALSHYSAALLALAERSSLLSNRALCRLKQAAGAQQQQLLFALFDACAAIVLQPTHSKPYHHAATAMLAVDQFEAAVVLCKQGEVLAVEAQKHSFVELLRRVIAATPSASDLAALAAAAPVAAAKQSSDREARLRLQHDDPGYENTIQTNMMLQQLSLMPGNRAKQAAGDLPCIDARINAFHTNYINSNSWPLSVDVAVCAAVITYGWQVAQSLAAFDFEVTQQRRYIEMRDGGMMQRLNGAVDAATLSWYRSAASNSIRFHSENASKHELDASYQGGYSSFSTNGSPIITMAAGTVHVAVGFVDLGMLRNMKLLPVPDADAAAAAAPLRWIGYEASAACVAKTIVIADMLQQPMTATIVDDVLECFYSSTWRPTALQAFRAALQRLLEVPRSNSSQSTELYRSEVRAVLQCWQKTSVSLEQARVMHLRQQQLYPVSAASFKQPQDQAAFCSYYLTGDVLPATAASTGSLCQFALPATIDICKDESVFSSVPLADLLQWRSTAPDILSAAAAYLRSGIARILDLVQSHQLTIDARFGEVTHNSSGLISAIHALQPATMSWSNCLDYTTPALFHHIARSCSSATTIHFALSINWTTAVSGVDTLDYQSDVERKRVLTAGRKQVIGELLLLSNSASLLQNPPIDNRIKFGNRYLATNAYTHWVKAFFARAEPRAQWNNAATAAATAATVQVLSAALTGFTFLSTAPANLELTFMYNKMA